MVYLLRVGMSKQYYSHKAYIFGLGHYKPKEEGEDEFSKKLVYFYKFGNNPEFFLEKLIDLYNLRFYDDTIKFDYLTLYPTRFKEGLNTHMVELVKKLSEKIGLPYRQVIKRDRDIKPNHGLKSFEERKKNVEGSVDITEDVTNKNIIIIDNTSTTGISLIDATNLLIEKGAKHIVCICLGLGYKGREEDWADINKTLKYSRIITFCKTPFVKREEREEWKKRRFQN